MALVFLLTLLFSDTRFIFVHLLRHEAGKGRCFSSNTEVVDDDDSVVDDGNVRQIDKWSEKVEMDDQVSAI